MNGNGRVRTGARASRRVTFDADAIRDFATRCGDHNPLHHDEHAAAAGPFGTLIASGPHVVALMMGLDATFLSQRHEALGLGFEFRFVRAVPAGAALTLEWTVTGVEWKESLGGDVVSVEGRAIDDAGIVFVTATGRNLVRQGSGIRHQESAKARATEGFTDT
jgi:3-hydroxybutyryl-CoA dehydratase